MKKITMDIGKILLSVEEDVDDKLILYANVNTENQQEFENSLNRVFSLLERLENVKNIVFNFGEILQVPGWFGDRCINSGIRLEAQKRQRQAMSQEIWLMRHGYHHLENGSLTEEGIERVKKVAAVFKDKPLVIYYSPIIRCIETATILKNTIAHADWHEVSCLSEYSPLPEKYLPHLKGETILIVSHLSILNRIVQELSYRSDNYYNFNYAWPVELISTVQGVNLRPLDEIVFSIDQRINPG
ncbi:MAG: histidine phosphatase family protein [Candidatus Competibacteraceae bacterium]|nr:histidine phosphatase family protein [Candidatus Competibacteraceae bacterium]